jgi:hypothetical protein
MGHLSGQWFGYTVAFFGTPYLAALCLIEVALYVKCLHSNETVDTVLLSPCKVQVVVAYEIEQKREEPLK